MQYVVPVIAAQLSVILLRLVLSLLLVAVQFYVGRAILRIIHSLELSKAKERGLGAAVIALMVVINLPLLGFIVEGMYTPSRVLLYSPPREYEAVMRPLAYVFFVWTFGSLLFAAASPIAMAFFAGVQFFRKRSRLEEGATIPVLDLSRRRFLQMALLAAASMPFGISAYGAVAAITRKAIERVVVPVSDLPAQLDGLTIVHMSDIHSGMFMSEEQMNGYIKLANTLTPDVVALTGDFVATSNEQVAPFIRAISRLRARYGVFGCLGNHDIFTHSEQKLAQGFQDAGFKLLRNRNEVIEVDGANLNVIGVDYIGRRFGLSRLDEALEGISLDGTTVLLCHAPNSFPDAARSGIDLMLAGHTHGGQVTLNLGELMITPARLATMFVAGLFKIGDSHLYVNRGLGTTGPPIRINAPPEITHITLRRA